MKLHIVTPLSRPENLATISKSISKTENIKWHIVVDGNLPVIDFQNYVFLPSIKSSDNSEIHISPIKKAFVGHAHRNYFINKIFENEFLDFENEFIYFLDDDTILHENFLETILPELNENVSAIIFDQLNKDNSYRLRANINNVKVCHIDMGQYIVNLKHIPKTLRFKEDDYCADGIFIEELFKMVGSEKFKVINKPLSYYNYLR